MHSLHFDTLKKKTGLARNKDHSRIWKSRCYQEEFMEIYQIFEKYSEKNPLEF